MLIYYITCVLPNLFELNGHLGVHHGYASAAVYHATHMLSHLLQDRA